MHDLLWCKEMGLWVPTKCVQVRKKFPFDTLCLCGKKLLNLACFSLLSRYVSGCCFYWKPGEIESFRGWKKGFWNMPGMKYIWPLSSCCQRLQMCVWTLKHKSEWTLWCRTMSALLCDLNDQEDWMCLRKKKRKLASTEISIVLLEWS